MASNDNEDTDLNELISDLASEDDEQDIMASENREHYERQLAAAGNPWNLTPRGLEAKKAAMTMLSTKNGMHARIPLICKASSCPYSETCQLIPYDLAPEGEYCPMELAQIDLRSAGYARDIDYDNASFTDRNLLSEIVSLDIMLERCRALMAKEGTPVVDIAIGVTDKGEEVKQPAVSKAWEAYEKISKKRDTAYQLMMMTRKDNKDKNDNKEDSLSKILSEISSEDIVQEP